MTSIAPILVEAERYLSSNDLDRAAECYVRAKQIDHGRSPLPLTGLARIALMTRHQREARVILDAVIAKHPRSVEAHTFLAVVDEADGRLDSALETVRHALAIDATYVPAHVNHGRICAQLERWPEAMSAFRTAMELAPQREFVTLFAVAATRAGELPEALTVLTRHLQSEPNDVDALVTLSDVLCEAGKLELAAELLSNAIERIASSPVLYARQSSIALRRGDLPFARLAVARQLALTPTDVEALLYAATLDLMKPDFASAEGRVLKVISLNNRDWRAHYQLGMIYEAMRLFGAARVAYRVAISHTRTAWQPRNNLAVLMLEQAGGATEARTLLLEAIALGRPEETIEARYNLALTHWKLGDKKASELAAREVAESRLNNPVVTTARSFLELFATRS